MNHEASIIWQAYSKRRVSPMRPQNQRQGEEISGQDWTVEMNPR